jgi:hypothetical protein
MQPREMRRSIFQVIPEIMINPWRYMYPHIDQYTKEYLNLCRTGILPSSGLDNRVFKLYSLSFGIGIYGLADCFQKVLCKKERE